MSKFIKIKTYTENARYIDKNKIDSVGFYGEGDSYAITILVNWQNYYVGEFKTKKAAEKYCQELLDQIES